MRWVWATMRGLLVGVVSSTIPFELAVLFAGFALFVFPLIRAASRRENASMLIDVGVPAATTVLSVAMCVALPFKYVDRNRVELTSDCVSIGELASIIGAHNRLPGETATQVCFTERTPTLRIVQEELRRQTNAEFEIRYCGTGATFLFGAYPLHRSIVAKK